MSVVDPVAEFEAWKATQPWAASVVVYLKRGGLESDDLYLHAFEVRAGERGKGYATAIMAKLAELADAAEVPLTLEVSLESDSSEWLQGWYERLGFEEHPQGYGEWGPFMIRPMPAPVPTP